MRIGLDLRMAGQSYGIGRYSFELARAILAFDRHNSYVLFVRDAAPFVEAGLTIHANVEIVVADFRHYSIGEQVWFCRLLNDHHLDLVHFMNFNVPVAYSRPYVVTIHDVVHHRLPGNKPSHVLHRAAYRYAIKTAARRSRRVITVSNFSKREIMEVLGIADQNINVVYEAATPVDVTDADVAAARQKFNLFKPYVVFVGVMERKKNIVNLAKGFDILRDRYEMNIQLAMVGSVDAWYPEVVAQAQQIKFAKDLIFTGKVNETEKYALLKGSQAFVSASLYEGFGLPGVEAMSVGIPLAVANTEVFNEVYDNGAVYFDGNSPADIADKLNLLLSDQKYSTAVAGNGRERAKMFSWERAARETVAIYAGVARGGTT
jgi:glycosyltransferase involved in cell wall biosynthesis